MTVDEKIARWMGLQRHDGTWLNQVTPRYTESLDAQLPVWAALFAEHGIDISVSARGRAVAMRADAPLRKLFIQDAPYPPPAEAAANAIHAALVAMKEIEE